MSRHGTQAVRVGAQLIGGGAQISVQSMTTTDTCDVRATVAQIAALADAGCDLVRLAVPDAQAAAALPEIVRVAPVPLVADIHFDYRLALAALDAGIAKLRINPGNIGAADRVRAVAQAAQARGVPIRVGVNAGSLQRELLARVEAGELSMGAAMAESALAQARLLEDAGCTAIVLSVKAAHVPATIEAYTLLAERCAYPLHIGVTEAGTRQGGVIKSAIGIGALLARGIGDTLRVSLTADPLEEVRVGRRILQALELRPYGPDIISCPTCGRAQVDVIAIAEELERRVAEDPALRQMVCTVAVMGCVVNGPGEGFAGGADAGMLFCKGEPIGNVAAGDAVARLLDELRRMHDGHVTAVS
ncbi:MAG: flavodoxin-dependent (E)-4-hydroxy-3-methylbut-2-enyl-diphosphate synthase [bacterium]|nr:flavodoxin-dependent (E)-4-hydroxy-3-methylbut-2-enyl-diphosphate synthase [bacterium]